MIIYSVSSIALILHSIFYHLTTHGKSSTGTGNRVRNSYQILQTRQNTSATIVPSSQLKSFCTSASCPIRLVIIYTYFVRVRQQL